MGLIIKLILFSAIFLTACSAEESLMDISQDESQSKVLSRVEELALTRSLNFLSALDEQSSSTRSDGLDRRVSSVEHIPTMSTRGEDGGDILLFNFDNHRGFTLVSSDTLSCNQIYMASVDGNLPVEALHNGSVYQAFYEVIENYHANYGKTVKTRDPYADIEPHEEYTITQYGPWIDKTWDQWFPFNCSIDPRYPVGCGPLAMASIMARHRYPASYNGTTFDWDLINSVKSVMSGSFEDQSYQAVSDLMKIAGEVSKVIYTPTVSLTKIEDVYNGFKKLGYICNPVQNLNVYEIIYNIQSYRPVYARVRMKNSSLNIDMGHAFVIDSYIKEVVKSWYTWPDGSIVESTLLEQFYSIYTKEYFGCKFGWNGNCDGSKFEISFKQESDNPELYPTRTTVYANPFQHLYLDGNYFQLSDFKMISRIMPPIN